MWCGCAKHLGPGVCDSALNHRWLLLSHRVQRVWPFTRLQTVSRPFLPCVSPLPSAFCFFHFFPRFLLIDCALICVDYFFCVLMTKRFPIEAVNQRLLLLIWLLLLLLPLTIYISDSSIFPVNKLVFWSIKCQRIVKNAGSLIHYITQLQLSLLFSFFFLLAIWTGCNMQLLQVRLEFIRSALCQDFLLLLF